MRSREDSGIVRRDRTGKKNLSLSPASAVLGRTSTLRDFRAGDRAWKEWSRIRPQLREEGRRLG